MGWWVAVLYGDMAIRTAGPIVLVLALIAGMYGRRYSPLSSSGWIEDAAISSSSKPSRGKHTAKSKSKSQNGDGAGSSSTPAR